MRVFSLRNMNESVLITKSESVLITKSEALECFISFLVAMMMVFLTKVMIKQCCCDSLIYSRSPPTPTIYCHRRFPNRLRHDRDHVDPHISFQFIVAKIPNRPHIFSDHQKKFPHSPSCRPLSRFLNAACPKKGTPLWS